VTRRLGVACATALLLARPTGAAGGALEMMDGSAPVRRARAVAFRDGPGGWRGVWDADTGVPLRLAGAGIAADRATGSPRAAMRAARRALEAHLAVLAPGALASDFHLVANHLSRGVRTVAFAQRIAGSDVIGGQISVRFVRDRLVVIASEAIPVDGPGRALAAAARGAPLLPLVRSTGVELRAVRPAIVRPYRVWLDPTTGAPVARESLVHTGSGTLLYDTPLRWPGGERAALPAAGASVLVDGAPVTADGDGLLGWAGTGTASVATATGGPYVQVTNAAGEEASEILSLAPGETATWDASEADEVDAQITAFVHAGRVKGFVRVLAPDLAWLDEPLAIRVNAEGFCNAFADGDVLRFFRGSALCHNAARLPDIVYHEFGHAFHFHSIVPGAGAFEDALTEGASDYLAATITNDPAVGRGFYRTEAPLRDIDPDADEAMWPDDVAMDPHTTGLILAGALWDLRTALMEDLGAADGAAVTDQLYLAVLQRASDIPSAYVEVLVADDDDGDLDNGTPHGCAIQTAFARHGLADPAAVGAIGRPLVTDLQIEVPVRPAEIDCDALRVDSMRILWHLGGDPDVAGEVDMAPTAIGYAGTIPDQPDGSAIGYQIEVTLVDGSVALRPANAADPVYQLFHGPTTPLYCTDFERSPAEDGWVRGTDAGEDRGDWEWGTPRAAPGSGDPDHAYSGELVYGNDLGTLGADGNYDPVVVSYTDLPPVTVPAGVSSVRLQYRRWLRVEDARRDGAVISSNGAFAWSNLIGEGGPLPHHDREWRFHDVDLTETIDHDVVAVRFELASDDTVELGGWTLDDVCVVAIEAAEPGDGGFLAADDGGCGCGAGSSPGGGAAVLALLGACGQLTRRRRRRVTGQRAHE
jgi:hypothetical protein